MTIPELIEKINILAWGLRGNSALQVATGSPAPPVVIVAAYDDLRARTADLNDSEVEILRHCCQLIRTNYWHGRAMEAIEVEGALPPPPVPPAIPMSPPIQADPA